MAQEVFITGATGFLGRRLLAELLRQTDCRFHVLVRSATAEQTLLEHLSATPLSLGRGAGGEGVRGATDGGLSQFSSDRAPTEGWSGTVPLPPDRLRFVHGDITLPGLGIAGDDLAGLAGNVNEVWHLAASTAFEESKRAETFHINVEGTRTLCGVLRRFRKLDVLYHMSTAYVCGLKQGCIPEGPVEVAEGYKNPYEESKHRSEEVVRASGLPAAILRPSIVMGDSRTGDNGGDCRMMYGYAYGILRAAMHAFESSDDYWRYWRNGHAQPRDLRDVKARLLSHPATTKNMVTMDDVIAVCVGVRGSGSAAGKTYNIVNRNNLTCAQVIVGLQRPMKITGYVLDPNLGCHAVRDGAIVERVAYRNTKLFWPYALNSEPNWETANTDSLGAERIPMTEELFDFMIHCFVGGHAPRG